LETLERDVTKLEASNKLLREENIRIQDELDESEVDRDRKNDKIN
jgi:hypothetical protein